MKLMIKAATRRAIEAMRISNEPAARDLAAVHGSTDAFLDVDAVVAQI